MTCSDDGSREAWEGMAFAHTAVQEERKAVGSANHAGQGRMLAMFVTRLRRYWRVGTIGVIVVVASMIWVIGGWWPNGVDRREHRASAGGLVCEEATWDFGLIDSVQNPELSHEFILTNESQEVVQIKEVRSTCGCVVADGYERVLRPGYSTRLTVKASLPPTPGRFQKTLAVKIEGSSQSYLPLHVMGGISANASLYTIPAQINFGSIALGQTKKRLIQVLRYDNTPVKLLEVIGSSKVVQCSFEAQPPQGEVSPTISVCLTAKDLAADTYSATITIRTEHKGYPEIVVPVYAVVTRTTNHSSNASKLSPDDLHTSRPCQRTADSHVPMVIVQSIEASSDRHHQNRK